MSEIIKYGECMICGYPLLANHQCSKSVMKRLEIQKSTPPPAQEPEKPSRDERRSEYEFVTKKDVAANELMPFELERLSYKLLAERDAFRQNDIDTVNRNIMWDRLIPGQPFGDFTEEATRIVDREAGHLLTKSEATTAKGAGLGGGKP